jgi:hypothetical protein
MVYTGPPIGYADYQREGFRWCQVVYLYARELIKAGADEVQAIEEATMVRDAMEPWGSPTPVLGAPPHERSELLVHWPTLVCAANGYASLPTYERLHALEMIRAGTPASELPVGYGAGACDRKVLDDEEYHPAPPCVPQQVASTAIASLFAFGLTASLAWLWMRRPFK